MVGTGGAVTVGLDGRTEAREQNSSHPSVGIVGLRHHWAHLLTRLKLEKWGSQKNHKIGTVNERPVSEQFPLIFGCWSTTPEFQQEIHISLPPWFFIAQDMHDCFESLQVVLLLQIWTHFRLTQVLCSWMPESCQVLATLSTVKKRPSGKPEVEQV